VEFVVFELALIFGPTARDKDSFAMLLAIKQESGVE
jgi:hypothetical protein